MIGFVNPSTVAGASPAVSRGHWYSATVSRKKPYLPPPDKAGALRRWLRP